MNPWFSMAGRIAAGVFGPGPAFNPDAPGPMSFSDRDKIDRLLSAAGWSVEIETEEVILTPMGAPEDVAAMQMKIGAAAMRMGDAKDAGTLADADKDAVRAGLTAGFADMMVDGAVRVPAQIHFVRATA